MKFGLSEESYNKIKDIVNKYNKYQFKIFGSRARGDYKLASDIDIAVYGNMEESDKYSIMNDLDIIDIPYMIDLVFMQDISKKDFIKSIERDGVIL